ncbi:MAG TPA: hypothetical protein VGB92_02880 [Longimicrobium sp.]|jgi:hypothetical protein
MRTIALLPLAALLALGCSSSATDAAPDRQLSPLPGAILITYEADRSTYRQGDTATIVLRNRTSESLGYNLCHSSRELRTGGSWTRISSLRLCTMELRILAPGAETRYREPITAEWQPGEYRLTTTVERMRSGDRGQIYTPAFTVER